MKKPSSEFVTLMIIVLLIFFAGMVVGMPMRKGFFSQIDTSKIYQPIPDSTKQEKDNLHLRKMDFTLVTSPTPTPTIPQSTLPPTQPPTQPPPVNNPPPTSAPPPSGNSCQGFAPVPPGSSCDCPGLQTKVVFCKAPKCGNNSCPVNNNVTIPDPYSCGFMGINNPGCASTKDRLNDPDCTVYCWDKPVLYFYPTEKTLIDVRLNIPGKVTVSDPTYPIDTGWQNVTAFPNGILHYNNTTYHYLYYETAVDTHVVPDNGIFIKKENLLLTLNSLLPKYGLNKLEQKEFLDYWMPELQKLHTKYIFFSVLNNKEKSKIDDVQINPKPDTFIHLLAYFKPVNTMYSVKSLTFPKQVQRNGFTVVEWGGSIDRSQTGSAYVR